MDLISAAQILTSLATLCIAIAVLFQIREQREARHDLSRPQVIVDVNYNHRNVLNIVVRNIGQGPAKNIKFDFSASIENSNGFVISGLPYFENGLDFLAPHAEVTAVWDSYDGAVQILRDKGLTGGITVTAKYEDLQGEYYETGWTINPLLLEGSGYSEYKDFEDQVRALEKISEGIDEAINNRNKERELTEDNAR